MGGIGTLMSNIGAVAGQIGGKLASIVKTVGGAIKTVGTKIGGVFGTGGGGAAGGATSGLQGAALNAGGAAHAAGAGGGFLGAGGTFAAQTAGAGGLGAGLKSIFMNPYVAATVIGKGIEGAGAGLQAHAQQKSYEKSAENIGRFYQDLGPTPSVDWSSFWSAGTPKSSGDGKGESPSTIRQEFPSVVAPSSRLSSFAAARTQAPSTFSQSADEILAEERNSRSGTPG